MSYVCKFCGCTENAPCLLRTDDPRPEHSIVACAWLLDDVCTNPRCVEKAYLEARPHAERLMLALELEMIA